MVKRTIAIIIGSLFIAIGINAFIIPHHLINGGTMGLGLIANYTLGLKPGLTIITLSLPLYLLAWFKFRHYFYKGLHGLLVCGFFIDLFHPLSTLFHGSSIIMSALIGGSLIGFGIGVMLLVNASTGGADLLALMIASKSSLNVGIIILMIDSAVILIGGLIIREAIIIYSFIMVFTIGLTTFIITKNK